MEGSVLASGRWRWSYIAFRFGDGATQALIPLAIILHYGLPIWVLALATACMNLASVPATFLWGAVVDRSPNRRVIVVLGFAMAAAAMAILATLPTPAIYVLAAMLYSMFGVASSPAASTLALYGVDRPHWARATTSLSRRTGLAYLAGMIMSLIFGLTMQSPPFMALFFLGAGMALAGAIVAARTIPDLPAAKRSPEYDAAVASAGQRNFERPVFFPGRMLFRPTLGGIRAGLSDNHRLWPIGIMLTFMGSVCFFTSYPGVLANQLLLPAGLVLLCQAPSHIITPFVYPWAGRHGARVGEPTGVRRGALLRLLGVPGLCLTILFIGAPGIPLILVFHALMGLSFALMQVNGPLILAGLHTGGKGQGVGLYHAAMGLSLIHI